MKSLRVLLAVLGLALLAACSGTTSQKQAKNPYLFSDAPSATTYPNSWTILTNIGYESAYDETFENPAWVAYHLTGPAGTPAPRPSAGYPTDTRPQSRVSETDYEPKAGEKSIPVQRRAI